MTFATSSAVKIVSGTVGINQVINIYPYLEQGSIFGKTFCVRTSSSANSGMILLTLSDKDGNVVSDDWIMGPNDSLNEYMFWPVYGRYTLRITSNSTTVNVTVDAWWQ